MLKNKEERKQSEDEVMVENLAAIMMAAEDTVVNGKTLMQALRDGGFFDEEKVN